MISKIFIFIWKIFCYLFNLFTAFGYRTQLNDNNTVPEVGSCYHNILSFTHHLSSETYVSTFMLSTKQNKSNWNKNE